MVFGFPGQEKPINSAIFPGLQGGPLMHVIAAKAVALGEALKPEFRTYQKQVMENAKTMAATLQKRGLRIVSGRTDCHMFLLDLTPKNLTGKDAEAALGRAHITVNKNAIPNDPQKPAVTSGNPASDAPPITNVKNTVGSFVRKPPMRNMFCSWCRA